MTIPLSVNGEETTAAEGVTVAELVREKARGVRDRKGRGVAVAVNGEVVPRSGWESAVLHPGDRIELLDAVGGG